MVLLGADSLELTVYHEMDRTVHAPSARRAQSGTALKVCAGDQIAPLAS